MLTLAAVAVAGLLVVPYVAVAGAVPRGSLTRNDELYDNYLLQYVAVVIRDFLFTKLKIRLVGPCTDVHRSEISDRGPAQCLRPHRASPLQQVTSAVPLARLWPSTMAYPAGPDNSLRCSGGGYDCTYDATTGQLLSYACRGFFCSTPSTPPDVCSGGSQ